jgi:hypothetical protein
LLQADPPASEAATAKLKHRPEIKRQTSPRDSTAGGRAINIAQDADNYA